ncbi:hypothetical protein F4859DRAFT_495751 [Xylaria cf. heliscus]|nr:hypothetical protein F4859DRAFT_495751 [Xylaria cf. heliscus]
MASSSERSRYISISAFGAIIVGTFNLQARYSRSAAFDRPIHFSIATLLLSAFVFLGFAKILGYQSPGNRPRRHHEAPTWPDRLKNRLCSGSHPSTFTYLVVSVVIRVLLSWRIARTIQCSWQGLYAFLPFFTAVCGHAYVRPIYLPRHAADDDDDDDGGGDDTSSRASIFRFAALALLWGYAVADLSLLVGRTTGVICPAGWYIERFIPLAQLGAVFLDAVIINQVTKLRQAIHDQASSVWYVLGTWLWTSATILSFLAVWSVFDQVNSATNIFLTALEFRDVVIDSIVATLTLVFGVCLLGVFRANLVSLVVTATTVSVLVLSNSFDSTTNAIWLGFRGVMAEFVVFLGFGVLLHFCRTGLPLDMSLRREHALAVGHYSIYAFTAFLVVLFPSFFMRPQNDFNTSPRRAMAAGYAESDAWLNNAMKSTSLHSAVGEYRRRYGMPPPPNFDKWYDFAVSVNSSIIDAFDQINSDLLPFWAISPALLRSKTTHLLEHPSLSMGGVLIQGGQTLVSPHIHGTHRWMVDVVEEMVKPFSQWLPDMQLAFNLDDECRIAVPVADMARLEDDARAARSSLESKQSFASFTQTQSPPWDHSFLDADESIWTRQSSSFQVWSKSPIFSRLVAATCAADTPANQVRWWNRVASCRECASAHMEHGFVRNWTLAGDVCQQPDLAHLHGFLASPAALAASQSLFPVFSQSRVHGFGDILYPSPWSFHEKAHYEEDKDVPWGSKLNSLYWRGASSDGFATHGSWQMFLRARFVHLASNIQSAVGEHVISRLFARRLTSMPNLIPQSNPARDDQLTLNVSFVGPFTRCDERDCTAEHTTFYGSASAPAPTADDFQETWRHRHLIDLDGAAFSGRFLPFVRSGSLPYRAALFRTWWEERVHPWAHYVPLDLRLEDLRGVLRYFGGAEGARHAEEIAVAGQRWARKALRREDMQVYMFRLLLEWGRLVDDRREELGFTFQ